MQRAVDRLRDFYQQELVALRDEASGFAHDFPEQARALGIHRGRSQDPQIELLMQSFAYLTGRLRYQIEVDQADLPNALLADLYPHLEAPLPCMLIAECEAQPDGIAIIERGRSVQASVGNDQGGTFTCGFQTCYETPLWPLQVSDIAIVAPDEYPELAKSDERRSAIKVRLLKQGRSLLPRMNLRRLRFYLSPEAGPAQRLHHLLGVHLRGLALMETDNEGSRKVRQLPPDSLRWLGFEEYEAVLPPLAQAHPAFRILQEYFAFPEKFLFFEIDALEFSVDAQAFELLFLLDVPPDPDQRLEPALLRTNCVPLINLYHQRLDPLRLDHSRYEYRLTGDATRHANCEIYRIEGLHAVRTGAAPRTLAPYFSMDAFQHLESQDYFYFTRRELSQRPGIGGTELYVSFLDERFELTDPADDVIAGNALCTNRRMPERLRVGDRLQIEGAAPVEAVRVLSKPTAHQTPPMTGARPWLLASQLALNHLSLSGGPHALAALKSILRMHVGSASTLGHRAIDGIRALESRPLVRWHGEMGRRGYVHGFEIDLTLDHTRFEEESAALFASVLRHFFVLFAAVNTVVQVRLRMPDVKGVVKEWPPLPGNRVLL
jgi:type VI secretion system protein ImpG